jgi:hypothetical protein
VAGECADGVTCPAVYMDDDGEVIVQGYKYEGPPEHVLPEDEAWVRVPRYLLVEAVRRLAP